MALSTFEVPIRSFVLLALVATLPAIAGAQSTQIVSPSDPVYQFVERLAGARLVDTIVVGQRMMSRREIGRIVGEARARLGADTGWLGTKLAEYGAAYPSAQRIADNFAAAGIDIVAADARPRGIETDGNGAISVVVNPLLSNQQGRSIANGQTGALMVEAGFGVTRWLTYHVQGRTSWLDDRDGGARRTTDIERHYGRAQWRNTALLVGRDHIYFGQGNTAGLTSSLNPRAVPQVRLSSDRPFLLPWILRHAGPTQATIALGDLGRDQHYPHTRLLTYKVSSRPHPRYEIGALLAEQVGGEGSPPGSFIQKAGDAFPLLDALVLHRRFLFSNKFVGVDMRFSVPKARGLQVYAEGAFDDFDLRRVTSTFTEDAGYVWGASMSCFRECGPLRVTAEYHVTGLRFFTHLDYYNGFTVDDQFLGDPLGPRGKGGYGTVEVDRGINLFRFEAAYEARSGNKYGSISTTPDDSDFRFVVLERHPTERRWRAMSSIRRGSPLAAVSYRFGGGVERVEHFAHVSGSWRTNWMARASVEVRRQARSGQ